MRFLLLDFQTFWKHKIGCVNGLSLCCCVAFPLLPVTNWIMMLFVLGFQGIIFHLYGCWTCYFFLSLICSSFVFSTNPSISVFKLLQRVSRATNNPSSFVFHIINKIYRAGKVQPSKSTDLFCQKQKKSTFKYLDSVLVSLFFLVVTWKWCFLPSQKYFYIRRTSDQV